VSDDCDVGNPLGIFNAAITMALLSKPDDVYRVPSTDNEPILITFILLQVDGTVPSVPPDGGGGGGGGKVVPPPEVPPPEIPHEITPAEVKDGLGQLLSKFSVSVAALAEVTTPPNDSPKAIDKTNERIATPLLTVLM
jgi:hypothetical protein